MRTHISPLIVEQKKVHWSDETRSLIIVFANVCRLSLSSGRLITSVTYSFMYLTSIFLLYFHLYLRSWSDLIKSRWSNKIPSAFKSPPPPTPGVHATFHLPFKHLVLTTLTLLSDCTRHQNLTKLLQPCCYFHFPMSKYLPHSFILEGTQRMHNITGA
jgi:hypothetical protein